MKSEPMGAAPPWPWARNLLWVGLGVLWLVDGALALQPDMYMNMLDIVAMGGWGQPAWMVSLINDGLIQWLYSSHLALAANLLLAGVQLGIGAGLLYFRHKPAGRWLLVASLPVAALIWFFGEWAGGLFGLDVSLIAGGPGAAMLYLLIALLLLQPAAWWQTGAQSERLRRWLGWTWLIGALLQCLPDLWTARTQSLTYLGAAVLSRQSLLTAPIYAMAALGARHPIWLNAILVLLMAALGYLLLRRLTPWMWVLGALVALFTWWIGENFGALLSGASTDPNTGPVWLLLLACAWWECRPHSAPTAAPAAAPADG